MQISILHLLWILPFCSIFNLFFFAILRQGAEEDRVMEELRRKKESANLDGASPKEGEESASS